MRSISTRFTGLLLVALGAWGGLVPFVGHYFHFALGPDKAWSWTTGRLYLDIIPGVVTVLGGLNLMSAGPRPSARLGALLALAGGIWFTIGPEISQLWHAGGAQGAGHGSARIQMLEMLTYHTGLGVLVASLAAYALPRFPALDEVAAPGRGRVAATEAGAGAGAAAGAAATRRGDRWDRGADTRGEPVTEREAAHADAVPAEAGTQRHHLGRDAAIGAGAAGAVVAEHHHRERVAEKENAASERAAEREAPAGEPVADRGGAAGEPVTERSTATGAPVTERGGAPGDPLTARDTAGSASEPLAADTGPGSAATTPRAGDSGHSSGRPRRRGGLLGNLLRR